MSNIFLVTSGIHGPNGINGQVPALVRIDQTIDTVKSIRSHVPDAKVYLLEGGSGPLSINLRKKFIDAGYDDILDFTTSSFISFAHEKRDAATQGITVIKGPCETYMLMEACKLLNPQFDDRIFKLSGRYRLSEEFNLQDHIESTGKYLFKKKDLPLKYYSNPASELYSAYMYSTRLYSFCGSITDQVINNYDKMLGWLLSLYAENKYIDIEHTTYLKIDPLLINETPVIGLIGSFAEVPDSVIKE